MTKAARMYCFFLSVCVVTLSATTVCATTVLEKSFADLVHEADTIVVGTVVALEHAVEQERPVTLERFTIPCSHNGGSSAGIRAGRYE